MAAAVYTLFSGSSGNSCYIGDEKHGIMIDAGKSAKALTSNLAAVGLSFEMVDTIYITHTHSDHISALKTVTKQHPHIKIAGTALTLNFLLQGNFISPQTEVIALNLSGMTVLDFHIRPFTTPHDAEGSCGYIITGAGGARFGYCTDLGYVSDTVIEALTGCRKVLIESNHDVDVLKASDYPYTTKQRILSKHGHLCNKDCAGLAALLFQSGCRGFILGHLSENNNLPQLAYDTTLQRLEGCGGGSGIDFSLCVAPSAMPSRHFEL